jgi:polysaccharide export outer membrane protein
VVFFRFFLKYHQMRQAALTLVILSSGLASFVNAASTNSPKLGSQKNQESKVDYVLQPSDLLKIQVFQEDDLTREVRISQEYTVKLPLVENVDLRGKTVRQAEEYIRDLYGKDFLVSPQVNLFVLEYAPRRVFVAGAVTTPGVVLFQQEQGLILIDAISRAGSFNRLADKKRVTLKRTKNDGSTETVTINVEELMKGETTQTWPLQPGDVINVPEKIL